MLELSTFRFAGTVSPAGYVHLERFVNDVAPTWIYRMGDVVVTRQLLLAEQANTLAVRYRVQSPRPVVLRVSPFVALRDFHALRKSQTSADLVFAGEGQGVRVEDRSMKVQPLWVGLPGASFAAHPQWWYRFQFPVDLARGQEGFEDLYTPGAFERGVADDGWVQLTADTQRVAEFEFEANLANRRRRLESLAAAVGPAADDTTRRLAAATDAFVVTRQDPSEHLATVVAGYHWFGDWGRDAFIALDGLRWSPAGSTRPGEILRTFAHAIRDGMIPNRFDDYGGAPHYNSIDASLWFVAAVEQYLQASNDADAWRREFMPARSRRSSRPTTTARASTSAPTPTG